MGKYLHWHKSAGGLFAVTALFFLVNALQAPWELRAPISLAFLLIVPGFSMAKMLLRKTPWNDFWTVIVYSLGLSTLYLMLVGVGINSLLPLLGNKHPLSQTPILISVTLGALLLQGLLLLHKKETVRLVYKPSLAAWQWLIGIWGLLLPVLAAGGATMLNNGGSNVLTMISYVGIAALLVTLCIIPLTVGRRLNAYALYMMGLALLFSTSLRGWGITGHDVTQEYQVFQLTLQHQAWNIDFFRDPYNACLSITVLPVMLFHLTGIAAAYIYKLVFQLIFAMVAPAIYLTISRFTAKKIALLSAFFFITFPTFFTDMPMLNRQEMAFFFLALVALTAFSGRISRKSQATLFILFSLGMVLSHYSTTYVAIGVLLGAKIMETFVRFCLGIIRHDLPRDQQTTIRWPLILLLIISAFFWDAQITNTSQGFAQTLHGISSSIPKLLEDTTHGGVSSYGLFSHHSLSDSQVYSEYVSGSLSLRSPHNSYYSAQAVSQNPVSLKSLAVLSPTRLGSFLNKHGLNVTTMIDLFRLGYAKIVQLSIILGLLLVTIRKRYRGETSWPFIFLGFSSVALMALQVLLPSSVINYGLLRFLQQSLIFLALPAVLLFFAALRILRVPASWQTPVIGTAAAVFFLVLSGVTPQLTGGFQPTLPLNNSGFYYEAYEVQPNELAGFAWMKQEVPKGTLVQADEFSRRQMRTYSGLYGDDILLPQNIVRGSYVYLSDANTIFNDVPFYPPQGGGGLLDHTSPTAFLQANKSLVYSAGGVQVYR